MKSRLLGSLLGIIFLVSGFAPPLVSAADVNSFVIRDFAGDYTLGTDDPQGTLQIKETIDVSFDAYNHGITRAIPKRYAGEPLQLRVDRIERDGQTESYSTYSSNGNTVLKIGDADRTITGDHTYSINYSVHNVVTFEDGKPKLNWNVNGTEWSQSFTKVSARLHTDTALSDSIGDTSCYTGRLKSSAQNCAVTTEGDTVVIATTTGLTAGETLTFNQTLPAGVFKPVGLMDHVADYGPMVAVAIGIPVIVFVFVFRRWFRYGRDARGRGTIVPEYAPPDTLRPAEVQTLLHNQLQNSGISATVIDLAIRKFIRIEERQEKSFLGLNKHPEYTLIRLNPSTDGLAPFEISILEGIFKDGAETVELKTLKDSFYKTVKTVTSAIPKSLTTQGYFSRDPATAGVWYAIVGFAMIFISFFLIKVYIAAFIGLLLGGIITVAFMFLAPQRTPKGAAAKDAAEGLKLYLETAEKDRIAMLQSPDAKYAPRSDEPVKTVELFEKLLPYAMVLGVEQQWANQFESIYSTPPDWYSGNWATFNAVALTSSLNHSMQTMNSSFASPSTSSSGFSGGAGGGGGGGGGGGW